MERRFNDLESVLEWCFSKVSKINLGDDYNRLSVMRNRYRNGKLKEKGIKYILDYFNVTDHCYYTVDTEEE